MKKIFVSVTGAIALVLGVSLNLQNAINDYGISSNSLSTFVLAQTNTSGTNSSGGNNSGGGYYKPETSDCILDITGNADVKATIFGCEVTTVKGGGGVRITVRGAQVNCKYGGDYQCTYRDCFTVFSALMKK